jgi:predicted site-specific integrase-resolvase
MTSELATRKELAERFKVSITTIRRWQKQGKLLPVRLSAGVVRYRVSQVEQFLAEAGQR